MIDIKDYSLEELGQVFKGWQMPSYHSRQVFCWFYQRKAYSFDEMTDLPLNLRRMLKERFINRELRLIKAQEAVDGTKKFLFGLEDDNLIESVLIPAEGRNTACLSTQVGCRYGCRFCASGLSKFRRNLSTWEIIAQILGINKRLSESRISHIVFMGIGEPLDNYDNVLKAIRIINCHSGLNIAARRITISTSGLFPAIERLSQEGLQIELSVSLHACDDKTRTRLMPVNKKYPLKELIAGCKRYAFVTGRQVTFEYVLLKEINSSRQAAENLAKFLKGWNAKVNLLIYNPVYPALPAVKRFPGVRKGGVKDLPYEPAPGLEVLAFRKILKNAGIPVTIRKPRGKDIDAACGQLRGGYNPLSL